MDLLTEDNGGIVNICTSDCTDWTWIRRLLKYKCVVEFSVIWFCMSPLDGSTGSVSFVSVRNIQT